MVTSVLLLALLFIAGLVNIYRYFSPKKLHAWPLLQSLFPNPTSTSTTTSTSTSAAEEVASSSSGKQRAMMSDLKKEEVKRVFATFDKNGDGFITKQELRASLKNIRMVMTEKEVEEMVAKVDANGDGLIDFDEFCILWRASTDDIVHTNNNDKNNKSSSGILMVDGDEEDELKEAFDVFDKDKDGVISVEELGSVLCSLGLKEGNKVEDCKAMISKIDMDGDGMVNFHEFKNMMHHQFQSHY